MIIRISTSGLCQSGTPCACTQEYCTLPWWVQKKTTKLNCRSDKVPAQNIALYQSNSHPNFPQHCSCVNCSILTNLSLHTFCAHLVLLIHLQKGLIRKTLIVLTEYSTWDCPPSLQKIFDFPIFYPFKYLINLKVVKQILSYFNLLPDNLFQV